MKHPNKRDRKQRHPKKPSHNRKDKKPGQGPRGSMTDVMVLLITEIDLHGDLLAMPEEWNDHRRKPPIIYVNQGRNKPALSVGDRVLANLRRTGAHEYDAHVIRTLPKETSKTIVGIFVPGKDGGGVIAPVSRKIKDSYRVDKEDVGGAIAGELVTGELGSFSSRWGMPQAKITKRLGDARAPHAASLIAAQLHKLRSQFGAAALKEAEVAELPVLSPGREDLRQLPLVTIDGEDARDFDDAVFAEPDENPKNEGGFHIVVAIADVAHYVRDGSALDSEAFERGNSVYFPDRVLPMLPEGLSNELCSLKPEEDRYCLAAHLWIDAQGVTRNYRFTRGLMRSHARLTYTQVEHAHSGDLDATIQPRIAMLKRAYKALARERDKRGTLEIHLPEYKVKFDANGDVEKIEARLSLESHRLIEAFMIAANVAAADCLLKVHAPGIYRVHEAPTEDKLEELRRLLGASGYSLPKGTITPVHLNQVLHKAQKAANAVTIHTAVLRSQMQAYYDSKNLGHFGLGLRYYCHFTSPIRRYSDLIVHRSLAALLEGAKGYNARHALKDIAVHISETERTAMKAERDALDRYKIAFIARQKEKIFAGTISSVNEYGVFVTLEGNGITGFVPVHQLGEDFFLYQARTSSFTGRQTKRSYVLGDKLTVRVIEADALKGSLVFKPETTSKAKEDLKTAKWKNKR